MAEQSEQETAASEGPAGSERLGRVPRGTLIIPVGKLGLGAASRAEEAGVGRESVTRLAAHGQRLHCLYQLLRQATQCSDENELLEAASRFLSPPLAPARLGVVFEAPGADASQARPQDVPITYWSRPSGNVAQAPPPGLAQPGPSQPGAVVPPAGKTPAPQFADAGGAGVAVFSGPRAILLKHARARGVALLSPDVELDERVATDARLETRTTQILIRRRLEQDSARQRTSLIIAPLLTVRTVLGYLVAERTYRPSDAGRPATAAKPFDQAHLEFLAAAAYPLATLLAGLRYRHRVEQENRRLRASLESRYAIIGESEKLRAALALVRQVAGTEAPVLLLGESGTGKELAARAIHSLSPRAKGPFQGVNCAALPESLIESELFGHVKGAFTGATRDRAGIFETAGGGTLFLDEIGELPPAVQAKLLRVLDEHKLQRVGESHTRDVDCRMVCATNRDLGAEVEAGRFRQDLYYRLRVVEITLPPLRERLEDLPLLCRHVLAAFGNFVVNEEALAVFRRYQWPGNVRELRNTLERMAVLSRPRATRGPPIVLRAQDVPLDIRQAAGAAVTPASSRPPVAGKGPDEVPSVAQAPSPEMSPSGQQAARPADEDFRVPACGLLALSDLQAAYARWVVRQMQGNKTKAAKLLGIQRSTLYAWTEWRK